MIADRPVKPIRRSSLQMIISVEVRCQATFLMRKYTAKRVIINAISYIFWVPNIQTMKKQKKML